MNSTKEKILDVAEELFADHGFSETSLRMITTKAEVNLASVNYHFGSKKTLIQAVFDRFMVSFTNDLSIEMERLNTSTTPYQVVDVLAALVKPLTKLDGLRPNGTGVFMNLLGRAYAETQGHIRRFAMTHYSDVFNRFTQLLQTTSPDLKPAEMFWRLHFMLGSFIFTLAGHKALQEISESDFQQKVSIEEIINRLVPYIAAGFSSDSIPSLVINGASNSDADMARALGEI